MSDKKRKETKLSNVSTRKPSRPLFTRQEYATVVDCMAMVKAIGENSNSLAEKRGVRQMLPHSDYQVGIIDKLIANTEPDSTPTEGEKK